MKRVFTRFFSITAMVNSLLLVIVGFALAQSNRGVFTQGTPKCQVFENTKCAQVSCSGVSMGPNTACTNNPLNQPVAPACDS